VSFSAHLAAVGLAELLEQRQDQDVLVEPAPRSIGLRAEANTAYLLPGWRER
jgi:hypothetical protein